jgi:UDP-N-acetylglucosamine transferase subunit ALG13
LVPRRHSRGEHIDDHQIQIAAELSRRGIAVFAEAPDLGAADLAMAASRSVRRRPDPPPIVTV